MLTVFFFVGQGSVSLSIADEAYDVAFYIAVDDGSSQSLCSTRMANPNLLQTPTLPAIFRPRSSKTSPKSNRATNATS